MQGLLFILLILFLGNPTQASQAELFGLDAASSARAGSVTASPGSAFSSIFNPALLSYHPIPELSYATSTVHADFSPLNSILLPRSQREGDLDLEQDFQPENLSQLRWALGVSAPVSRKFWDRQLGFGATFSGPYDKLRNFTAYAPDDFHSLHYGAADGQFKATLAGSLEILPESLFFGTGIALYLNGLGSAETYLASSPESRLNLNVTLQTAAILGLYARLDSIGIGLSYREKIAPRFEQAIDAYVPVLADDDSSVFRQPLVLESTLYFEPETFDFDLQIPLHEDWTFSAGFSYQLWGAYEAPILRTQTESASGRTYETQSSSLPLRNTLNPRASLTTQLVAGTRLLAGYQFRPSPLGDLTSGANALDTDCHILGLGVEQQFGPDFSAGLFGQYHFWNDRQVTKITGQSFAGSPGYTLSGKAYTLGLSVKLAL